MDAPFTVLYVEDEEFDVFFMRRAFRTLGLEKALQVAADGQQAIDYLAGHGAYANRADHPLPSLIVLDLNLPLQSGFQVLQWVRCQPALNNLPVVIFSSSARPEDKRQASELGATDYFEKPPSGLEFSKIAEALRRRWMLPKSAAVLTVAVRP